MTVYGHHVDVASADTDRDALLSYARELDEQLRILGESLDLYSAATSAYEKQDAMLAFEVAYGATIDHMGSLYVPACAVEFDGYADAFLAAIGVDFQRHKSSGDPLVFTESNTAYQAFMLYATIHGKALCVEATV